jgi:hypothetical protein
MVDFEEQFGDEVCAKVVTENVSNDQLQWGRQADSDLVQRIEKNGEQVRRVITMDECWGFQFVPDIKRQSIQWKFLASACPKWMSKSKVKTILIYFFDCKGMVQ